MPNGKSISMDRTVSVVRFRDEMKWLTYFSALGTLAFRKQLFFSCLANPLNPPYWSDLAAVVDYRWFAFCPWAVFAIHPSYVKKPPLLISPLIMLWIGALMSINIQKIKNIEKILNEKNMYSCLPISWRAITDDISNLADWFRRISSSLAISWRRERKTSWWCVQWLTDEHLFLSNLLLLCRISFKHCWILQWS